MKIQGLKGLKELKQEKLEQKLPSKQVGLS